MAQTSGPGWGHKGHSQEPVEDLAPETQADGGVADVKGQVLLGPEVEVRGGHVEVGHPHAAKERSGCKGFHSPTPPPLFFGNGLPSSLAPEVPKSLPPRNIPRETQT